MNCSLRFVCGRTDTWSFDRVDAPLTSLELELSGDSRETDRCGLVVKAALQGRDRHAAVPRSPSRGRALIGARPIIARARNAFNGLPDTSHLIRSHGAINVRIAAVCWFDEATTPRVDTQTGRCLTATYDLRKCEARRVKRVDDVG